MMDRRQFLGASAALATLPETARLASADDQESEPDAGSSSESLGVTDVGAGYIELEELVEHGAEVRVRAYHYADEEEPLVELNAGIGGGRITLSFSPAEADDLADRLAEAARYAEEGSR